MCTCIQHGVENFRKKKNKSTRLKGQYSKYKNIYVNLKIKRIWKEEK